MLQLFEKEHLGNRRPTERAQDPQTSFRQMEAQDVVLYAKAIYESHFNRITTDPTDNEANAWFFSEERGQFSFLWCCSIYSIDADNVRSAIKSLQRKKP